MNLISRLLGNRPDPREAVRPLWHRVVEIARDKRWYAQCGVADTVPGRFDAVTLVLSLVMLRMERDKHATEHKAGEPAGNGALIQSSARLTELFVEDMDGQLRQSGVGDLVVGKQVGKLMSVLAGRIDALRDALGQGDAALIAVLERNMTLVDGADLPRLAAEARALHARIQALSDEDLLAARIAP